MKKSWVFILCLILSVGFARTGYATDAKQLGKEDILQKVSTQNQQLKLYEAKIDIAKKKIESAKRDINFWASKKSDEKTATSSRVQNDKVNEYNQKYAEYELKKFMDEKHILEDKLKREALGKYYELSVLKAKESSQKNTIARLKREKEFMVKKIELGIVKASELSDIEMKMIEADIELSKIVNNQEAVIMDLEAFVGESVKGNIKLVSSVENEKFDFKPIDLASIEESYLSYHPDIYWKRENLKLEEINYKILSRYKNFDEFSGEFLSSEQSVENLNYEIKEALINTKYNLNIEYNDVLKSKNNYELQKLKVAYQNKQLDIAKIKQKAGLISELEYLEVLQSTEAENIKLLEEHLNYFNLFYKLDKDIEDRSSLSLSI